MDLRTTSFELNTPGKNSIHDITPQVSDFIMQNDIIMGQVLVFAQGSTTGITTLEFEPGLVKTDMSEMFDKFAPYGKDYAHNATWNDDNGASHLRSALVKPSMTIPFIDKTLCLGTWQQIVFIDFDTRPRIRNIFLQLSGK
jgi:secondary thiamine-phosphate synthase enzyme